MIESSDRKSFSALWSIAGLAAVTGLIGCAGSATGSALGGPSPATGYEAWVASESVDEISLVRYDGERLEVIDRRSVGSIPVELEGPHGIAVSPDGDYVYVSLGHGLPSGSLLKIDASTGRLVGRTPLGFFPATVSVTPDGEYAFVSNFNLHGDPVPSSISMVHLPSMVEVARTETCVMPHGSRLDATGSRHYSVCMMDDRVVELDAATGGLLREFDLTPGREGPFARSSAAMPSMAGEQCWPTWAEPSADGSRVFVTCNRGAEVLEIDVDAWRVVRRFPTGANPYNLGVTPDGRLLLVTLRNGSDPAVEVFDLASGRLTGRIPTTTTLAHGIAVTPDSRYAFVTSEGVGSEPGRVDFIDLTGLRRLASAAVGQQATGVAIMPLQR